MLLKDETGAKPEGVQVFCPAWFPNHVISFHSICSAPRLPNPRTLSPAPFITTRRARVSLVHSFNRGAAAPCG